MRVCATTWLVSFAVFFLFQVADQLLILKRLGTRLHAVEGSFAKLGGWMHILRFAICIFCCSFMVFYAKTVTIWYLLFLVFFSWYTVQNLFPLILLLVNRFGIYENGIVSTSRISMYIRIKYFSVVEKKGNYMLVFWPKSKINNQTFFLPIAKGEAKFMKKLLNKACKYADIRTQGGRKDVRSI